MPTTNTQMPTIAALREAIDSGNLVLAEKLSAAMDPERASTMEHAAPGVAKHGRRNGASTGRANRAA